MSEQKTVEAELIIDADAETVWRALTEGEELKRWFLVDARVNPGEGGSIWMSFGEGMDWETPITVWEPNRHLGTGDPVSAAVDYYIESKGGETVLRIVQSGFGADAWDDELDTLNSGWRGFLATLQNYLRHHRGERREFVHFRHPTVEMTRQEAFPKLLEALGVPLVSQGETFTGPLFTGVAAVSAPPVNFSGPLENLGNGFLFLEVEPGKKRCRPSAWVSLYGEAATHAPALQEELRKRISRTFGSEENAAVRKD